MPAEITPFQVSTYHGRAIKRTYRRLMKLIDEGAYEKAVDLIIELSGFVRTEGLVDAISYYLKDVENNPVRASEEPLPAQGYTDKAGHVHEVFLVHTFESNIKDEWLKVFLIKTLAEEWHKVLDSLDHIARDAALAEGVGDEEKGSDQKERRASIGDLF